MIRMQIRQRRPYKEITVNEEETVRWKADNKAISEVKYMEKQSRNIDAELQSEEKSNSIKSTIIREETSSLTGQRTP